MLNLCNATCIYVFGADHLVLDNQVFSFQRKIISQHSLIACKVVFSWDSPVQFGMSTGAVCAADTFSVMFMRLYGCGSCHD